MAEGQHWLVVSKVDIDGSDNSFGIDEFDDYEIEHPEDCPRDEDGGYVCSVGWQEYNGGVRFSLRYSGTPVDKPGRYPIVSWNETYRGFDYVEHDGGLAIGEIGAAGVLTKDSDT